MTDKKYELVREEGKDLFRVRALRDIPRHFVRAGDLGGLVGSERNLSQEGDAWIGGNAKVYGEARVCGDAAVYDNAKVYGNAKVSGNAEVYGNAKVCGKAEVSGDAAVYGNAKVYGDAAVYGDAKVYGDAAVYGDAKVYGDAAVYGDAKVYGDAAVYGNAVVCREADISETRGALTVGPIGSRDDHTTFFKGKGGVGVSCGCFCGTLEEFAAAVERTHKDSPRHLAEYRAAIALARARWGDGR